MITKGRIESIDGYKAKVRLPIYNGGESKTSTKLENLPQATCCSIANIDIPYAVGDIVFVGFEDNDTSKPIILGHLYKSTKQPATPGLNLSTLNTSSTTKLSESTWVGKVKPNEIASLTGVKSNIQSQLDYLEEQVNSLSNIDLSSDQSQTEDEDNNNSDNEYDLVSNFYKIKDNVVDLIKENNNYDIVSDFDKIKDIIIDLIYPIGSVYIDIDGINPQDRFKRGQWIKLSGSRYLYNSGADNNYLNSDSLVDAGLPNITGSIKDILIDDGDVNIEWSGALSLSGGQRSRSWSGTSGNSMRKINFDASWGGNTYYNKSAGSKPTVDGVRVHCWKRVG